MVIGVTILVFFIMSLSPVDEALSSLGENATPEQLETYRVEHGLNDPAVVRYFSYMGGLCVGDFGTYGASHSSVGDYIAQALPITLELTFAGTILGLIFAVIFGVDMHMIESTRITWSGHLSL